MVCFALRSRAWGPGPPSCKTGASGLAWWDAPANILPFREWSLSISHDPHVKSCFAVAGGAVPSPEPSQNSSSSRVVKTVLVGTCCFIWSKASPFQQNCSSWTICSLCLCAQGDSWKSKASFPHKWAASVSVTDLRCACALCKWVVELLFLFDIFVN